MKSMTRATWLTILLASWALLLVGGVRPAMDEHEENLHAAVATSDAGSAAEAQAAVQLSGKEIGHADMGLNASDPPDLERCKELAKTLAYRGNDVGKGVTDFVFENSEYWQQLYSATDSIVKYYFTTFSTIAAFNDAVYRIMEAVRWMHTVLDEIKTSTTLEQAKARVEGIILSNFDTSAPKQKGLLQGEITSAVRAIAAKAEDFCKRCYSKGRYRKKFVDYYKSNHEDPPRGCCLDRGYENPAKLTNDVLNLIETFKAAEWRALQEACVPQSQRGGGIELLKAAVDSLPTTLPVPAGGFAWTTGREAGTPRRQI
mmetsp:Transcript_67280/g.161276  ORF Transcript_67280/g.161276 Transcript_67280/m.161276 type:complete len:315 (+) Transcript_67280:63-1007(+)